jgi:DNA-binding GntR family transcriptional regulator
MSHSNAEIAYQKLHELIAVGDLQPGARIMETEIASITGLSRTPVREAIKKLESNGLVEHKPRIGAVVRTLTYQEVVELYEMRIVLERAAVAMATKHISAGELALLKSLNEEMHQATDAQRCAEINVAFHSGIFAAARNQFLITSYKTLADVLLLLGSTTLARHERLESAYEQHVTIIQAIQSGDPKAAADAMEAHMDASLTERIRGLP